MTVGARRAKLVSCKPRSKKNCVCLKSLRFWRGFVPMRGRLELPVERVRLARRVWRPAKRPFTRLPMDADLRFGQQFCEAFLWKAEGMCRARRPARRPGRSRSSLQKKSKLKAEHALECCKSVSRSRRQSCKRLHRDRLAFLHSVHGQDMAANHPSLACRCLVFYFPAPIVVWPRQIAGDC